ncbi:hypothetical protein L1887_22702 [Cichorium endivia]|nr:hypothetical protein L1887_22702 [Cichorium endivia]
MKRKQEIDGNVGKKESQKWTEMMDTAFIEAMVTQHEKGNRISGTITSLAYANMVNELNEKLQMNLTKDNLKNRLKSLKSYFSQWHDMFKGDSLSGFAWNSNTQLIEPEDDVWENLIKSKPEAILWKTKKVANYDNLERLFSKQRANGEHAETAQERNARMSKTADIKIETITDVDDLLASNDVTLEKQHNDDDDDDIQVLSPKCFSPDQNSCVKKYKSKKRKVQDDIEEEPMQKQIINLFRDVANAMRESNKILERAYHHEYTGDEIYKELEPLGLDPNELPGALMYLARNQADARTLFTGPLSIRVTILKTMMGAGK